MATLIQDGDTGLSAIASGSSGLVFPGNVTSADAVVLLVVVNGSTTANDVTALSSPSVAGNTWTRTSSVLIGGGSPLEMETWVCLGYVATGNGYINVTTADGKPWTCLGVEFYGTATSAVSGTSTTGTGTAPSISETASSIGDLIFAVGANPYGESAGPASPWTLYNTSWFAFAYSGTTAAWQTAAAAGTLTATWTSASTAWGCLAFILKGLVTKPSFTVTFNNNGGTGALTAETKNTATALSLFSTGTMARTGYSFTGWNTVAGGGGTAYADGASYPFTANVTLYAQWAQLPPYSPTLSIPANAGVADVSAGCAFTPVTFNSSDGESMYAYAMRIKVSGGSYQYWNAGTNALQSGLVWNVLTVLPGGTFGVTLPSGILSNSNVYNWSFASQCSGGGSGPFATDFTFTATASPTVTAVTPSGTITGVTEPLLTWSEVLGAGSQTNYQVAIESGTPGSVPGTGVSVWNPGVVASATLSVLTGVPLTPGVTYRWFIQVTETGGLTSAWDHKDFTIAADVPALPTFVASLYTDPVTLAPEIKLQVNANDNQLTNNQSTLESGTTVGYTAGANTTISAQTTWVMDGSYSMRMVATAGGAVSAQTPTGVSAMLVSAGETVRAMGFFHSPTTPRACTVAISFYNAAGAFISTSTSAAVNSTTAGAAGQAFLTCVAPAGAAFAALTVGAAALGAAEAIYCDELLFAPGASTLWTKGGFVGSTTLTIQRSDGAFVRGAGWDGTAAIPANQALTLYDLELSTGIAYTYSAIITYPTGPVSSAPVVSAPVTMTLTHWDAMDPVDPTTRVQIEWAGDSRTFDQPEAQGDFNAFGRASSIVVHGTMFDETFSLVLNFGGDNDVAWKAFNALRKRQVPLLLRGDMPGDLYYVALGATRPMVLNRTGQRVTNPTRTITIPTFPVDRP